MGNRYNSRIKFLNDQESYDEIFRARGVPYVKQYGTTRLRSPGVMARRQFSKVNYVWRAGDRYYKVAIKYYKDPQYWWVIALYNQLPTEGHLEVGDVITIPLPLENVLRTMGS